MQVFIPCSVCGKDWYAPNPDCIMRHDAPPVGAEDWRSINNSPVVMFQPQAYERLLEGLRDYQTVVVCAERVLACFAEFSDDPSYCHELVEHLESAVQTVKERTR